MEIYTAQGKKLNDTVMSVLENNVGVHHHVCQDNFCNSVNLAENLKWNITVCGMMKPNKRNSIRFGEGGKRAEARTVIF
jgi:hypothetical protein